MEVKVIPTLDLESMRARAERWPNSPAYTHDEALDLVQAAIEECAKACEEQQKIFASPEYCAGQPLSSFKERFACGQCAEEIRKLAL